MVVLSLSLSYIDSLVELASHIAGLFLMIHSLNVFSFQITPTFKVFVFLSPSISIDLSLIRCFVRSFFFCLFSVHASHVEAVKMAVMDQQAV